MAQMEIPPVLGTTNENDDSVPVPLYQCWDALAADMSAFTGQQSQLPSAFEVFGRKNTDTATPSIDGFAALFEGFHLLLHSLHSSNDRLASVGDELVRVKADFLHSLTREKKLRSEVERLQRLNFNAQAKLLQAQQRLEEVERLGKDRQRELRRVTSSSKLGTSPKSPVIIQFPTTTNTSSTTTTTRVLVEMDASFFEDWTRHHRQFSAESPATSPALLSSSVSSPASSSTSCAAMKKSHSSAYLNSPPAMKKLPSSAYLNSPPATPPSSRRRNSFVSSSSLPGSPPSTSNNAAINVMHNILHQQSLLLEAIMSSPSSFPPPPPSPLEQEDEISIHHQTLLVNDSRRKELENERNEISKEWKRVGEERVKVDKERETFQIEKEAFEEEVRSFWLSDEVWSRVAAIQKEETSTPPLPPPPLDDSQLLLKTVCDEAVTASSLSFSSSPSLLLQSSFPSLGTIVLPPHDPLQSVRVEGSIPPSELSMNGSSFPVLRKKVSFNSIIKTVVFERNEGGNDE